MGGEPDSQPSALLAQTGTGRHSAGSRELLDQRIPPLLLNTENLSLILVINVNNIPAKNASSLPPQGAYVYSVRCSKDNNQLTLIKTPILWCDAGFDKHPAVSGGQQH